ncbi:MAG: hypothetical protein IT379_23390 [Deltaproteobacteria bacterium]|nr:hypothetical protein [Deltaproteobacteria bacterium]
MTRTSTEWIRIAAVLGALAFAACGDDDGGGTPGPETGPPPPPPADMGPDTGPRPDMATPVPPPPPPDDGGADTAPADMGPPGPTMTMTGRITDFISRAAVEGLEVCIYELPDLPCATTDADGMFVLPGVPAEAEVRVTYRNDADGWQPTMVHFTTPPTDTGFNFVVAEQTLVEALAADAGITVDPTKATVVFNSQAGEMGSSGGLAGVVPELDPDDAETVAFLTDAFAVSTTLGATSNVGFGFFANVEPGPHTLRITHPDRDCRFPFGWRGAQPNETRIEVVAGWFVSPSGGQCNLR